MRKQGTRYRAGAAVCVLTVALAASPALAQDGAVAASSAGAEAGPGEIVVTAQRRTERLIDVPVSIAVVNEDRIKATGALDVGDLGSYVPNVAIVDGTGLGAAVIIRGVGSNSRNIGFDSRVGVYLDGIYLGQSPAINQQLSDIEQVEVLRGPQGALFGKNTVAGAINLITKKPSDEFEAYLSGRYGNYNAWSVTGRVNVPLADGVAAKVSVNRNKRDGFIVNLLDDARGDDLDNWSWRGQLRIDATPNLQLLFSGDGLIANEHGSSGNVLTNSFGTALTPLAPGRREIAVSRTQTNDRRLWGASLDATYSFDSGHSLVSQTSYRFTKFRSFLDPDYSPLDVLYVDFRDQYKQYIEEIRLVSPAGRRLEYLAGLYYFHTDASSNRTASTGTQGGLIGAPINTALPSFGDVTTRNIAFYANATYDILPDLELGAGFRFSRETKKANFTILGSRLPSLGLATGSFADKRTDEDFSPSVTLTWKVTPGISAYARYAEGYKSGGYNLDFVSSVSFPAGLEFDKETVRNYEVGVKASVLNGRIGFGLSGFVADYQDYQINQFRDLGGGRTAIVIGNAATVSTKGIEFEVNLRPARGLNLAGGIGFLQARYNDLPATATTVVSGALPGASDAQANASADYESRLGNSGLKIRANLTYTYRGPYFTAVENTRLATVGSPTGPIQIPYGRVTGFDYADARVAVGDSDDRWEIALFGRNITNNTYVDGYERDFFGTLIEGLGDPRTYGVEATLRF